MGDHREEAEDLQYKFNGETHHLITPHNIADLKKAGEIQGELLTLSAQASGTKEQLKYSSLGQEQEKRIQEYLERFDTFDNRILNNNINYLAKLNDIKMGALESYIGLSTGYISRTAKDGAVRRLSIEAVWKIAKFFDIDISTLVGTDLQEVKGNTFLLMKFINKVIRLTKSGKVQWDTYGGPEVPVDPWFTDNDFITAISPDEIYYHPEHLGPKNGWLLHGDIMKAEDFNQKGIGLVLIPYNAKGDPNVYYDYFFTYDDPIIAFEKQRPWQKVMFTPDDPYNHLTSLSEKLYSIIVDYENDAKVDSDIHDFLEGFVD